MDVPAISSDFMHIYDRIAALREGAPSSLPTDVTNEMRESLLLAAPLPSRPHRRAADEKSYDGGGGLRSDNSGRSRGGNCPG